MNQLTKAASDVLAERARQVNAEGWTPEHDDEHVDGSMARAAACYVEHACSRGWVYQDFEDGPQRYASEAVPFRWPDAWDASWWKPKNPRRDLVRAAALLLAEIERLDRAPAPGVSGAHGQTVSPSPTDGSNK